MAIRPKCDRCGRELSDFGAVLLSPPDKKGTVRKFHICRDCYLLFSKELKKDATAASNLATEKK